MNDRLLEKFMEKERWEKALQKSLEKGISKSELKRLCSSTVRKSLYVKLKNGNYEIMPPKQIRIPKDDGDFRIVYVNEDCDRVFLGILNDLLFEEFGDMVHPSCKSYQSGIGVGKILKEVSTNLDSQINGHFVIGIKADLTKYFDSVKIEYIDNIFNRMEKRCGKSALIDVLRRYYHSNVCFDFNGNLTQKYQSLKQGCAISAFLADALLFSVDRTMNSQDGYYVRYSDDILYIGRDYQKVKRILENEIRKFDLVLNPNKLEILYSDEWFKFLGFYLRGEQITLSKGEVKKFQKMIENATIKKARGKSCTEKQAVRSVMKCLYGCKGDYSWATRVLPIINVQNDLTQLNLFTMDCIRACITGKGNVGGLGSIKTFNDYTVVRGTGKNVKSNREKTSKTLDGFISLRCAQNALLSNRKAYDALVKVR